MRLCDVLRMLSLVVVMTRIYAVEFMDSLAESFAEKWIADSGASSHLTHSVDQLSDVRLCNDKVKIGDNDLIDVVDGGTLAVVFPGDLTVKLLDVGYMPYF